MKYPSIVSYYDGYHGLFGMSHVPDGKVYKDSSSRTDGIPVFNSH